MAEIDAAEEDVRAAVRALGVLYDNAWDAEDRERLLHRTFPACLVVGLAGMGSLDYTHGNYWTGVWEQAAREPGPNDQGLWGDAFRAALTRFGLARFEGLPQINVSEILIHAGIPSYCLADLLGLLAYRETRSPDLTARDLLSWATAPGHESRLNDLDMPVRRFLRFGGEYAEDFIDRCLDLLDRLRQPAFDADGLGLPARTVAHAQDLSDSGMLDLRAEPTARQRSDATAHPALTLEPFGRGPMIWLPPVEGAPEGRAVWQVQIDGDRHTVSTRSLFPAASETAPAATQVVDRPARRAIACLSGTAREFEVDLIDPDEPLLVFGEEGRRIPRVAALTADPVWLMHPMPDAAAGAEMEFRGPVLELEEVPPPYGWDGWRLRRVDLRHTSALRFGTSRWRLVQGSRRARLDRAAVLPGVSTVHDTPIFAEGPQVVLPADPGTLTVWSIRIRRPGETVPLRILDCAVEHDTIADPWTALPRPLVGLYEITVRGPLGRGLHRTLTIVEGLRVRSTPRWRKMGPDGLEPASVYATGTIHGLRIEPAQVGLTALETTAQFAVSGGDRTEVVRVTPPHMAVQRTAVGEHTGWSLRPIRLATESLRESKLLVRLPAVLASELVVRHRDNDLQHVPAEDCGGQALARFDLGRIIDTVGRYGTAGLEIEIETERFPVARCTPARLAEQVVLDPGGWLQVIGGTPVDGLSLGCYQLYSPWLEPTVLHVGSDLRTSLLPHRLRWGGPLVVLPRIDDPWLPAPWPAWPATDSFGVKDIPWSAEGPLPAAVELSGFLAGKLPMTGRVEAVPLAVEVYKRSDDLRRYGVSVELRASTASLLATHPAATLAAALTRGGTDVVAPLIHGGLAALARRRYLPPEDELRLWNTCPIAAMLASAHVLAASDFDATELREQLTAVCGPVANTLLAGKPDPYARVGSFDAAALRLAGLPTSQVDTIWRAAAIVPRGVLEPDERVAAARELFDARNRAGIARIAAQARPRLAELRALIGQARGQAAVEPIDARGDADGWLALPALSLALAVAARISADGHRWPLLTSLVPLHAALARHAPRLVTVDLLLAELLLHGADA